MNSRELRKIFVDYFTAHKHKHLPSSPLLPADDPTLLFNNAGMNQFKDFFLGLQKPTYSRAVTAQKCIRAGGKHNDLENVGFTYRHLTFFEMLGNFSFGDYFKKDAIDFAWEMSTQYLKLDPKRIWVTIHPSDEEAYHLWLAHVKPDRILRMEENFWMMGPTGPCGPCSELYYDRGPAFGTGSNPIEDTTGDRVIEYWNLVFMQFDQKEDGTRVALPKPSIDTGMGLERVLMLKNEKETLFDTGVLWELVCKTAEICGINPETQDPEKKAALRVIADHIRTLSFAISDGIIPGPGDRGYVLRKILRRAVRYGRKLGLQAPFLAKIVPTLVAAMGEDYPELTASFERIISLLTQEEEQFFRTLSRGGKLMQGVIEKSTASSSKRISGKDAFLLYDTYGFPQDEILLIAKDHGLSVDLEELELLCREAKERSRSARGSVGQQVQSTLFEKHLEEHPPSTYIGDRILEGEGTITAIFCNGVSVDRARIGDVVDVIIDRSYFYPEKGGQVGDIGMCYHKEARMNVTGCFSPFTGVIVLKGEIQEGSFLVGEPIMQQVNSTFRKKVRANHTATHLLHKALEQLLGPHIKQAGSLVDAERLRFDFTHHKKLTSEELFSVMKNVNCAIEEDFSVNCFEIPLETASADKEIKQFFGEKYGAIVRVVDVEGFSKELCGGSHVEKTGEIGLFYIIEETSIAAGIRRIEAWTGWRAKEALLKKDEELLAIATLLECPVSKISERAAELAQRAKQDRASLEKIAQAQIKKMAEHLSEDKKMMGGVQVIHAVVDLGAKELSELGNLIAQKVPEALIFLAAKQKENGHFLLKVGSCAPEFLAADKLLKELFIGTAARGGGKKEMAQGSINDPSQIDLICSKIKHILQ